MRARVCKSLSISSPAKLNLFLDIIGKRPDGYHDIITLFERISLSDTIKFTEIPRNEIILSCDNTDIPLDSSNLIYKAVDLIKKYHNIKKGINIELNKNIPIGAGLAGGSSNAAATLLCLNKFLGLKLDKKTLMSYANELGSDVAFFILGKSFAIGEGRGTELTPVAVEKGLKLWHILFVPYFQVLTKDVYGLLDKEESSKKAVKRPEKSLKLTKNTCNVNILISKLENGGLSSLNRNIYNRLSETVMKSYSLVSELKADLLKNGLGSIHMSGSGPALFTIFKSESEAKNAFKVIHPKISHKCRIFLTNTL